MLVCVQCGAGRPRAPSPRPSAARPSRHGLPSPALPPGTEPWGWGAGTCRESKTRGWRRAGKGSSCQAAIPWAPPLLSPKMLMNKGASLGMSWCWPKVLRLLLAHLSAFMMPKLGTGGWQKVLDAPKGLNNVFCVGSCFLGHGRGVSADAGRSWKIAATAAELKPKRSETPRRGGAGCLEFSLHQKFISLI